MRNGCRIVTRRNFKVFGGAATSARGARGKISSIAEALTTYQRTVNVVTYCRTQIAEGVAIEMMVEW